MGAGGGMTRKRRGRGNEDRRGERGKRKGE